MSASFLFLRPLCRPQAHLSRPPSVGRCDSLKPESILLRGITANLMLFKYFITGDGRISAPRVKSQLAFSLRNMKVIIDFLVPKTSVKAKLLIVKY